MRMLLSLLLVLGMTAPLHAQDAQDDPLLQNAIANLFGADSFNYALSITMTMPDGTLQAGGRGAYQSGRGGFLSIGSRAAGVSLDLSGNFEALGTSQPLDMGAVVLGETVYLNGVTGDGWVQMPLIPGTGGLQSVIPNNPDAAFLTVTRLPDTSIGAETVAAYRMNYDLTDPAVRGAVADATAGMPNMNGALATGEAAAALLDDADLTVIQYVSLETQQVRRITVEFRVGDTTLQVQADFSDYGSGAAVQPPADAEAITPGSITP